MPLPRRDRTRARLRVLFGVYVVLLIWIVLWKLNLPWIGVHRLVKLVPFVPTGAEGPSEPLEIAINFLLFVPFGIYLALLAPSWRWWRATLVVAGTSLLLEAAQFAFGVGSSDTSDLIVNTMGGLAGMGLVAAIVRRQRPELARAVIARGLSIGTVLAVAAAAVFVAAPLHYGRPPGDGPRQAPGQSMETGVGTEAGR
ncbi:VanZ family protein [Microbacterium sp. 4R-513]|uniref:VanZ family protein n=1 Tax=Microbacterium sp. 4R-513 TaxID=2567934 RepID=UPI0013E105E2|nr:VanZ family protein [Microbacterium sp. 4R-513]QIG40750.1 VanZ family protein [Microbacterium sp. 4R-513]